MASTPRAVVVTRPTEYERLLGDHGTHGQAAFFLASRGQSIDHVQRQHERQLASRDDVLGAIPSAWHRASVERDDLARFLFGPGDVVVVVGQDGLVANVAKYLDGQAVIGINPDADQYEGVLVPHPSSRATELLLAAAAGTAPVEARSMVQATVDDGQALVALNEVFLGHASHQSARYEIAVGGREELQSSSGVLVVTGTGATGWGRSIHRDHRSELVLPAPVDARLAYFVREAFPSPMTGTSLVEGIVESGDGAQVHITSRMAAGGTIFGDGIEADRVNFEWGMTATVELATARLHLVR
jgi:hypothetical protein